MLSQNEISSRLGDLHDSLQSVCLNYQSLQKLLVAIDSSVEYPVDSIYFLLSAFNSNFSAVLNDLNELNKAVR